MLSHSRRDGDTFCDHQSYWVDCDGDGSGVQARNRVYKGRGSIVFASAARHGGAGSVWSFCMRRGVVSVGMESWLQWDMDSYVSKFNAFGRGHASFKVLRPEQPWLLALT